MDGSLDLQGWSNYTSAEDEPEVLGGLIEDYIQRGFCHELGSMEEARDELGRYPVINKLGLVSKMADNGVTKHRIIWDLKESAANLACNQAERIVLPRLLDLAGAACDVYRRGLIPWILAVDVRDAFLNIPAGKDKAMTVSAWTDRSGNKKILICDTLVFGSKSSPTLWGRFAAWLGRSWAAIVPEVNVQIYVDDPAMVAEGTLEEASHQVTLVLIWAAVAGYPLKLSKAVGGKKIKWIGAEITLKDDTSEVQVSIPWEKKEKLLQSCLEMARRPVVTRKKLSSLAGGLSFVAGLVPHLRPFLDTLWAALARPGGTSNDGVLRHSGKMIHVRRFAPALQWVVALLKESQVPLTRILSSKEEKVEAEITTDASPWGLGAVLRTGGQIVAAFASPLTEDILTKFQAKTGDPKFTTLWEALALLTAFRLWLPDFKFRAHVRVKADSLSSLVVLAKGRAKSLELNVIAREVALDQALQQYRLTLLEHIPGVTNLEADYLSRIHSPHPPAMPEQLKRAALTPVKFGEGFWRVVKLT